MSTFGEALVKAVSDHMIHNKIHSLGPNWKSTLSEIANRLYAHDKQLNEQREKLLKDSEWLAGLQKRDENQRLNIQEEYNAAKEWYSDPNRRVPLTRDRFRDWLKEARSRLPLNTGDSKADKAPIKQDPYIEPTWDWRRVMATKWPREAYPDRPAYEELPWREVSLTVRQEILKHANQT